ncbi:hypothetical protein V8F06_012853 [Rhypophila decipiens]
MVNSAYNQLDVGIPISVPVEVVYIKNANADEMNPPVNPRITVGGIALQEYLRRLYRSLPASYHEPDLLFDPFLTKAEIFNRLAKWCEPNMTRGIRTIHNPYNARSKILQLALAKPGYWDEATYGYGLERSFWYGRAGHAGVALATRGALAKGGLVVFLVIVVWLFAKNWGIPLVGTHWQDAHTLHLSYYNHSPINGQFQGKPMN